MDELNCSCINVFITKSNTMHLTRMRLLNWVNNLLDKKVENLEDLCSGELYCRIIGLLFPDHINVNKIHSEASLTAEKYENFKLLQKAFNSIGCNKDICPNSLLMKSTRCHLDLLQFFYVFYNANIKNLKLLEKPKVAESDGQDVKSCNKASVFVLEEERWILENHRDLKILELSPTNDQQSLIINDCQNTIIKTVGRLNSVDMNNCRKVKLFLHNIISTVRIKTTDDTEVYLLGMCPKVILENSNHIAVFLNESSASCETLIKKCGSISICRETDYGKYINFSVPENIKCVIKDNKLHSSLMD